MSNAFIKAIEYYIPQKLVSNDALAELFPDWDAEKIYSKLGIRSRYIATEDQKASDLAVLAAEKLFSNHAIDRSTIDYVLYCTQSPDYFLPTTACLIQDRLGLPTHCGAIDINQGCSGYVYGLGLAKGLIAGGIAKNVLFLTGETYSKYIHPTDKSNLTIFGDAGTATLISEEGLFAIENMYFGTDGKGASNLIVENGGSRNESTKGEASGESFNPKDYLYMDGPEIFNFTLYTLPQILKNTLQKNQLEKEEVDYFIFHQANKYLLDTLQKKLKVPADKYYNNIEETGNTVSCTIAIALKNTMDGGQLQPHNKILLAGFGVGYSWGGCVLTKI